MGAGTALANIYVYVQSKRGRYCPSKGTNFPSDGQAQLGAGPIQGRLSLQVER